MAAKVLVVGPGAIGALYGGVLARAGCEVSVVARGDHDAVAKDGYRIEGVIGDISFRPAQVLRSTADWRDEADYILVALKLVQAARAANGASCGERPAAIASSARSKRSSSASRVAGGASPISGAPSRSS